MSKKLKQNCLTFWKVLDPIYYRFTRLDIIENRFGEKTIMRVRLTKYRGRKVMLSDGAEINKNDLLLKIHLHNVNLLIQLQEYDNDTRRALLTYKLVKESLQSIVNYIQLNENANRIKGLIGITTLHKGCKRLGFDVHPIPNSYYRTFKQLTLFPIYKLSTRKSKEMPNPVYLFMSKDGLLKKYQK